jgi:hypothetical protein
MEKEMRELYIEGVAIRGGPESCAVVREGVGEALIVKRRGHLGVLSKVVTTIRSTCSSVTVRGHPGRGSSNSPSSRRSLKRLRHFVTVGREIPSRSAISPFAAPCAAASTIRERNANACAVLRRRDHASNRPSSSSESSIATAIGAGMTQTYHNRKRIKPTPH